jgi:glycosyltransferase involved in cell wall biosynthesis/SAM-dependent methyltransferase
MSSFLSSLERHDLQRLLKRAELFLANFFYQLQLIRLKLDQAFGKMFRPGARKRIMATACWSFPIYSQTFVYQELTQLIRRGFKVRFIYSRLDREQPMPSQFSRLWRARRRLILHPSVCERSYAYFLERMPERIDALVEMLCRASGMTPQEVRGHYHFLQAFSFARMVEAYRPDYLHSYFFYEGTLFTFIASYLLDIPRGVSCYADHMLEDYALKVVPLHLRQCSLVVATSERIRRELRVIAPELDPERIIVKPNAINAARFPVVSCREPKEEEPFRLISVNRIEPKKGLLYLVEAAGHLRSRGIKAELHLVGGVDDSPSSKDYARELEARIQELDLGDIVHLEGRKTESEINRFFKNSHIFIAPFVETEYGDKDGVPTSLLEGMAAGLPVVATDAGSIREVIENGRDGLIVAQRDSGALAIAIADLIGDPERRARLGNNAAQKVRKEFDVTSCEHIFHDNLSKLLASGKQANGTFEAVRFGSLRQVTPISRNWGFDRGLPVDRYYIENFLARHSGDIRGRVLEIEDDSYTRKFGGDRVTTSDVLHVVEGNPRATIVGDLTVADHIPSDTFDCIVLTQTLHIIYDTRAALRTLHRILKFGGVLLATFPGISRISHDEWKGSWFWGFTTASSRRLFEEVFSPPNVEVEAHGNVLAAISFLHGVAVEELSKEELDYPDPDYEVLITVRAAKSKAQL